MLKEIQVCPSVRRKAQFRVPSASSPGVDYTVEVTIAHGQVSCTCPGFRFRGTCNHTMLQEEKCAWSEADQNAEKQTKEQAHNGVCPRCGGPTIMVVMPPDDTDDSEAALRSRGVTVPSPPKLER